MILSSTQTTPLQCQFVCYRPTKKMIIKVAREQNIVQTFITIFFKLDLLTRTEAFFYFPLIPILSFQTFSAINNFTFQRHFSHNVSSMPKNDLLEKLELNKLKLLMLSDSTYVGNCRVVGRIQLNVNLSDDDSTDSKRADFRRNRRKESQSIFSE